jgi:hypothetical protein
MANKQDVIDAYWRGVAEGVVAVLNLEGYDCTASRWLLNEITWFGDLEAADEVHRITVECPDCAVLILHHANKAGGLTLNAIRGSSRFPGEVDLSMIVKVEEPGLIHAAVVGRKEDGQVSPQQRGTGVSLRKIRKPVFRLLTKA